MARVGLAEEELAAARVARAALDAEPDLLAEPHQFRTFGSIEELHAGASFNPGPDTAEIASAIRERFEGEQG
jgi:hypothetical protein